MKKETAFDWLALWIVFSAWSSLTGWGLSAFGSLNQVGIILSFSVFLSGVVFLRAYLPTQDNSSNWKRLASRFFRLQPSPPQIWLLLTVLVLLGGISHTPNNYDYLTYRFTRVLYWSWDQGWSWVPTVNQRINYSGTGFEWLMVPLFIVFKTDRLFFLINFVSYLFLPGMIFSVFSQLGISKRICWWWMWVLPCGYCFILQAASVGNDCIATVYLLASLYYLFQAKAAPSVKNLALSCLSIALVTGVKASNLPLVLPWLTLLFFQRKQFLASCKPAAIVIILLVSSVVSFLPMALLNIHYTGDFAGDPTNSGQMKISNPVAGLLANSFQLIKDNLAPPVSPCALDWGSLLPGDLNAYLRHYFPRLDLNSGEMQIEEHAGVGVGIVLFASLFLIRGVGIGFITACPIKKRSGHALWVVGAGLVAWLAYMSKMGSEETSRLLAAYYPLLSAGVLVLASLDGQIMSSRVFKGVGYFAMLSAIPLVFLSPARPLLPVNLGDDLLAKFHALPGIVARYNEVYGVYAKRSDAFQEIVSLMPPNERTLGLVQESDDPVADLWRPFGSRNVVRVSPADSREQLEANGVHFIAVSQDALDLTPGVTIAWLSDKWSGTLVAQKKLILKARLGPVTWYLLKL